MPRSRSYQSSSESDISSDTEIATGASPGPQEDATAQQATETDTESQEAESQEAGGEEKEQSFTLPAEDEAASLVRPGIGMEDVPTPETQPDPEDFNEAVFAKKREAWEAANPEAVQQNKDRDAAHEQGKPYQPEQDKNNEE